MVLLDKYNDWEGTAEALAELAGQLMQGESSFGSFDAVPNERLVRDYVTRGILSKPKRRGKVALFCIDQLVQFLACRKMLADGWPLSKIASDIQQIGLNEVRNLVTGDLQRNETLDLIDSFRQPAIKKPDRKTPLLSISELSQLLKSNLESNFDVIRVRAEISRPTRAASGHLYFTLKDENNILEAVCWKTVASSLGVQPEEGLNVVVTGKLSVYGGRSKYQIIVQTMDMAGKDAMLTQQEPPSGKEQLYAQSFREKQRRSMALRRMESDFATTVKFDFTALQLATWLVLLIDPKRLEKISVDEAEAIGLAVTAGLLNRDKPSPEELREVAKGTLAELEQASREKAAAIAELEEIQARQRSAEMKFESIEREIQSNLSVLENQIQQRALMKEELDLEIKQKRQDLKS